MPTPVYPKEMVFPERMMAVALLVVMIALMMDARVVLGMRAMSLIAARFPQAR